MLPSLPLHSRAGVARVALVVAGAALLGWMFAAQAWVVDDAYITLRTVDNFVSGRGLGWNPGERVQAFTHPLWMFCLCALYLFTREGFLTVLALSFAMLLALLGVVAWGLYREPAWKTLLFLGMLVASKAFFDFTSSGLENPLTVLLVAIFASRWLAPPPDDLDERLKRWRFLLFVAALAFFNRIDTLLLYLPALGWELVALARRAGARIVPPFLAATSPATGWLAFSLIYFGAPFPNTAYAKALGNGVGAAAALQVGGAYFRNGLEWDPATQAVMALALVAAIASRRRAPTLAACGMVSYLLYVAAVGAAGTHMSGRFFSGPYVLGALILLATLRGRRSAIAAGALVATLALLAPGAPLRSAGSRNTLPRGGHGPAGIIDTRWIVHREGAALARWREGIEWPNHGWYEEGLLFRGSPQTLRVGGAASGAPIGYFGYAAGPDKYIVDVLGLTDPLLARLPMRRSSAWTGGHFVRDLPRGYVESLRSGGNSIEDPDLRAYYDRIRLITRGPIFSLARLRAIYELNTGRLDPLVEAYASRAGHG
ncbi:MAG TPA: hypothetical protein VN033_02305 [Vulgatibacter sp.]|nr:hypothetical protein [Vulgatibacter sp.]